MSKSKKQPMPESNQLFRTYILTSLSKISNPSTVKTGIDELREYLSQIKDMDRLQMVLSLLSDSVQNQKISTKREYVKVYGLIAEVFGSKIIELYPKIMNIMNRKLKEPDGQLNIVISETIGQLITHIFRDLDSSDVLKPLWIGVNLLFDNFSHEQKNTQIGSAMCISRMIQTSPVECLSILSEKILIKISESLSNPLCRSQAQLLESLLSLILGIEEKFRDYISSILPIILECMGNTEWTVRKLSNDVIYTLCVLLPDEIKKFKESIIIQLNKCKFDKIKHVREAATLALNIIKDSSESRKDSPEPDISLNDAKINEKMQNYKGTGLNRSLQISTNKEKENKKRDLSKKSNNNQQKKNLKIENPSILNRPINPDFLKNAVKETDGIEIITNSPLLNKNQNLNENNNRSITKKKPVFSEHDEDLTIPKINEQIQRNSPEKNLPSSRKKDIIEIKEIKKSPPKEIKEEKKVKKKETSTIPNTNINIMNEQLDRFTIVQNHLIEKVNYIEFELKREVATLSSKVVYLENLVQSLLNKSNISNPQIQANTFSFGNKSNYDTIKSSFDSKKYQLENKPTHINHNDSKSFHNTHNTIQSKEIFEKVDQNIKDMNEIYASFNNKSNIINYKEPIDQINEERDFTFPQESYEKKNFDDILSKPFSDSPHEHLYYKPLKLNNYFENK